MKKELTSLFLASTFILTACSKSTEKVVYVDSSQSQNKLTSNDSNDLLKEWQNLILDGQTSLQIAEILAAEVVVKNRQAVKDVLKDFSEEDLKSLQTTLSRSEKKMRSAYFHQNASWSNNPDFLSSTIITQPNIAALNPNSLSNRIIVTVAAKAREKLLNDIMVTYSHRMATLAQEMAPDFASEMQRENPREVAEIEKLILKGQKDEAQARLQKVIEGLKKFDDFFKNSGLNDEEQTFIVLSAATAGAIAYKIYDLVKENKSFQKTVSVAREAGELQKKFKELQTLTKSLQVYADNMAKDSQEFVSSSKIVVRDINEIFNEVKENGIQTDIDARKSFQYIYDKVISGKKKTDTTPDEGATIATKTWKIDPGITSMVDSADRMTSNFSAILDTTTQIAQKLGIKVSPEIAKIIEKANKVNQVVSLASKVIQGLSSGGVLGAVQAFAGGPIGSLLGGGNIGFEGRVMSEFKAINKKLDEIIKLQKVMIDLQMQTMGMIQKLALLMDQYHQEEMVAIAALRNISIVNLEIQKMMMNEGIRSCEKIVNFHLNNIVKDELTLTKPGMDANIASLNAERLFDELKGFKGVQRFIRSTHGLAYEKCQDGLSEAFGRTYIRENPILSLYSTTDDNDLKKFYEKNYLPLYKVISDKIKDNSTISMALHAPIEKIKNLHRKFIYTNVQTSETQRDVYDIKNLISPIALERYAAQLLILHPYLELDKTEWEKDIRVIFEAYMDLSNEDSTRSLYLLKNALSMTQSAIAQEAILAGEPILDKLQTNIRELFQVEDPCEAGPNQETACAVRTNPILLKNLMMYSIFKNHNDHDFDLGDYNQAFEAKDTLALEKMIFGSSGLNRVQMSNDQITIVTSKTKFGTNSIPVPTPNEMNEGKLFYSENMGRLVRLQDKLLDALVRITPSDDLLDEDKKDISILLLSKFYH